MSGGAPIPVVADQDESPKLAKIICVADLEREGSKKLSKVVRGKAGTIHTITSVLLCISALHQE
jgi:hypothetical protein